MKWQVLSLVVALAAALKTQTQRQHGPVVRIVEMLQGMAEKSEADGKAEAETFDKFQCDTTKTITAKGQAISELKELMASTQNRIEKLTALSSELSSKKKQLKEDLEEKKGVEAEAIAARENEEKSFKKQEADMAANLGSLTKALAELNEVSANPQAVSLLSTDPAVLEVTKQLESVAEEAKHFLTPAAADAVALMRGPNYEQQSGGVLGTLQSVKDTYEKDLKELKDTEESKKQSHAALLQQLKTEQAELSKMLEMTEAEMASTAEELATRKSQLKKAQSDLESESALKAEAEKVLVQKTSAFEERKELMSQELTAISKATAVLKSDAAFATFGQISGASFVQMAPASPKAAAAVALLRRGAVEAHSARLGHVVTLAAKAPLAKVIEEIETMQKVIQAEGKADEKKSAWCMAELSKNAAGQKAKSGAMDSLNSAITELGETISSPVDGLQVTLKQAEEDLKQNQLDQEEITASRKSENKNYQKKVQDLQDAQKLVKIAMTVLQQYYTKVALIQGKATSSGDEVLKALQNVLVDSTSEEDQSHQTEGAAQASFEENMELLTRSQSELQQTIADTTKEMADTKKELTEKREMLEETKKEKMSLAQYLADVEPNCQWLKGKLPQREANRQAESKSLTEAIQLIKGTPAYQKTK